MRAMILDNTIKKFKFIRKSGLIIDDTSLSRIKRFYMNCPDCGKEMVMESGMMVCPDCDMLNKTIQDKPWFQGDKDDNSEIDES